MKLTMDPNPYKFGSKIEGLYLSVGDVPVEYLQG